MESPQFKAYVAENINLTKSLCIKSQQTIDLQNNYLHNSGHVVTSNPYTWKYYKNLAGEYHPSDEQMHIISSDSKQLIPLTKTILSEHPLTAVDYSPRGIYHKELLEKYPHQRDLILRIFNPVDITAAIDAPDGTILFYDSELVHPRELSLIPKLQKWLYAYYKRWHIGGFYITDPLYPAGMLAVMYHAIPTVIMNLRMETCKTNEVAEFHLWGHLGSRYRLDRYRSYLTNRQTLFLYRNIDYLRFNVGKEKTMLTLLEKITGPVNIKASKYDVTQDDSSLLLDRRVTPAYLKSSYDESRFNVKIKDRYDTQHVMSLTKDIGIHGDIDYVSDVGIVNELATSTIINEIPTGVVELNAGTDHSEIFSNPKIQALNHWFHLSSLDMNKSVTELDLRDFGRLSLTTTNAALLLMYSLHRMALGGDGELVPTVGVMSVIPKQNIALAAVESRLTDGLKEQGYGSSATGNLLTLPMVTTVEELQDLGMSVSRQYYSHYLLSRKPYGSRDRSIVWDAVKSLYVSRECRMVDEGTTWGDWLQGMDFPSEEFTYDDYYLLVIQILRVVVGIDIGNISLSGKHNAMIDILKLLTSYGIIFCDGTKDIATMRYLWPWIDPIEYGYSQHDAHALATGINITSHRNGIITEAVYTDNLIRPNRVPTLHSRYNLATGDLKLKCHETNMTEYNLDICGWESGPVTTTVTEGV